ncbi:hypothetical protein FPZ43_15490 [Mucilaginibacter pallidiroseus]|uniref:Uncharacterized protein n=1 Tax=Mucilaginibacter pallidiroseus TaxID=2599295 RepID=A0A563U5F0_9SPHI|nr:hypothetical protein [Mucilaginibacter pallidiroseus]TWR26555.1 hypothetical protein FPZ43_15490 [Mucilaginibacter pallidiroseus]
MFGKLFLLVKDNANAVLRSAAIEAKDKDAVINDASSSIIDVLRAHVDGGKIKELINYFQFSGMFDNPLITRAINSFANKLNNFYNVEPKQAHQLSSELIAPVMQELIRQSKEDNNNNEFSLRLLLSNLSDNVKDMGSLLNQLRIA